MEKKKYFELTAEDLRDHPIWVLAGDVNTFSEDDDEEQEDGRDDDTNMVVPLPADLALRQTLFDNCICYARANFVATNGRRFVGMMKCWAGEGVEGTQPAIVTDQGQVHFYLTIHKPTVDELARDYARLGISAELLFPLEYCPEAFEGVDCPGGVLHGFYYMDSRGKETEIKSVR